MRTLGTSGEIEQALRSVGGSALNLLGLVSRATTDVDILAFASPDGEGVLRLQPPDEPLPGPLRSAAAPDPSPGFSQVVSEVIRHVRD